FSPRGADQASAGSTSGSIGAGSADQGMSDRARDIAGSAQEKLADVGSGVRERAGHMKDSLADALDSGADKLRQRATASAMTSSDTLAGATGSGGTAISSDGKMSQLNNRVAGGMSATADWLRDADLDGMKAGIERQVKEHPGRTLLVAVGVGYLLGKALRK
ncbi:MAG TPA: hypothetical protein VN651_07925, partial [Gemmatimonadaceae bacterium]|nr:hypothetical protein [Gemmatimonadaceae bacterium]